MSNPQTSQIQEISAHPGPVPGAGTRREEEVCKYIDVTTCIGCKACEVACVEWNDHPFRETTFDDTYQTMPSTEWNYWNLIKFVEDQRDGNLMWLMRKDQCMHCEDPGCLRACTAVGAIIKYENGIVDFQHDNCIGCGYCISGCPFDRSEEHTSELQSQSNLVCRLLLEKKNKGNHNILHRPGLDGFFSNAEQARADLALCAR